MLKSVTWSRRLLVALLSVILVLGMIVTSPLAAYGDNQPKPTTTVVDIISNASGELVYGIHEIPVSGFDAVAFAEARTYKYDSAPCGGSCTFIFQSSQNEGGNWTDLFSIDARATGGDISDSYEYSSRRMRLLGARHFNPDAYPQPKLLMEVGLYRFKAVYDDDPLSLRSESDWYEFRIVEVADSNLPPGLPSNPPSTYVPPAAAPASPVVAASIVAATPTPVVDKAKKAKTTIGTAKKTVNVYTKASSKAKILKKLKKGSKVTITGKSGSFYKVTLKIKGKTKVGYVLKTSIKVKK
jgi:hypothetical protein